MPDDDITRAVHLGRGVLLARDAAGFGITQSALRWAEQSGRLRRLRPGAYTLAVLWQDGSARERHILLLRAAQRMNPSALASGPSAAVVLGWPVPRVGQPQLAGPGRTGRRAAAVFTRGRRHPVLWCHGIRLAPPVQVVLDCARQFTKPWGLAVADAAVALAGVTTEELLTAARDQAPGPGAISMTWACVHARAKVESPLESLARAGIILAGLPAPTPQVWIPTVGGRYRVDLLDDENRVVTEADGKVKYVGDGTVRPLWEEKLREDAIRDTQREVVRFTMADHHAPAQWLHRYRRAVVRGRRFLAA